MRKFNITVNGTTYEVDVEEVGAGAPVAAPAAPKAAPVAAPAAPQAAPKAAPAPEAAAPKAAPAPKASGTAGSVKVEAPMPGTVLRINVKVGDAVTENQSVVVLEAMKMENEIVAPKAGTVASINVDQGASVNTGDVLITLN